MKPVSLLELSVHVRSISSADMEGVATRLLGAIGRCARWWQRRRLNKPTSPSAVLDGGSTLIVVRRIRHQTGAGVAESERINAQDADLGPRIGARLAEPLDDEARFVVAVVGPGQIDLQYVRFGRGGKKWALQGAVAVVAVATLELVDAAPACCWLRTAIEK